MTTDISQGKHTKGYIDAFLTILIWSGFVLVSRVGGKSPLLPYDVVALRFGTAAVILLPFWLVQNRINLFTVKFFTLAFTGGIGYAMFAYLGFKFAPAAHGAILISGMLPFEIAFFSFLILHERPTTHRLIGLLLIALGVVCLAAETLDGGGVATWKGDITFIAASTLWAFYTVLVRKWKIRAWDATMAVALLSAFIYLPIYWLALPKQMAEAPWQAIGLQAFYQGIMAVIIAMVLYMRAVAALGPSKVGVIMALVPVISGLAASVLLDEPLTVFVVAGLGFTSLGAWVGNRRVLKEG